MDKWTVKEVRLEAELARAKAENAVVRNAMTELLGKVQHYTSRGLITDLKWIEFYLKQALASTAGQDLLDRMKADEESLKFKEEQHEKDWEYIGTLEEDMANVIKQCEARDEKIEVLDKLLAERNRLLEAIPECQAHGDKCVPHAIEWVNQSKTDKEEIERLKNFIKSTPNTINNCTAYPHKPPKSMMID